MSQNPMSALGSKLRQRLTENQDLSGGREQTSEETYCAVFQARLSQPSSRRLFDEQEDYTHVLNPLLACFENLPEGVHADVQAVLREAPDFGAKELAKLAAEEQGIDTGTLSRLNPRKTATHAVEIGAAILGLLFFHAPALVWLIVLGGASAWSWLRYKDPAPKAAAKPAKRGRVERVVSQDTSAKVSAAVHADMDLRVGVWGPARHRALIDAVLASATREGFAFARTHHQSLRWEREDPKALTVGLFHHRRTDRGLTLTSEEAAVLLRTADKNVASEFVDVRRSTLLPLQPTQRFRSIEDPLHPPKGLVPLGVVRQGSDREAIYGLHAAHLDKHAFIQGRSGTGKSELMKWLVEGCLYAEYPVVVIDPDGPLAEGMLHSLVRYAPEKMREKLLYCDLGDTAHPLAMNPLDVRSREAVEPAVARIMRQVGSHLGLARAERAERWAAQAITAMAEANLALPPEHKLTLLQVSDFFNDREFRYAVTRFATDLAILNNFGPDGKWDQKTEKEQDEFRMPITQRFDSLSTSRHFARLFASPTDGFDIAGLVGQGYSVLVNLGGEAGAAAKEGAFVGSLLPEQLFEDKEKFARKVDPHTGENIGGNGCRLFVDEGPALFKESSSVMNILARARKWDLGLTIACQYPAQFSAEVISACMGNTSTKVTLGLEATQNARMVLAMQTDAVKLTAINVASLRDHEGYVQVSEELPEGGKMVTPPFAIKTLAPLERFDPFYKTATPEQKAQRREEIDREIEVVKARSHALICNPAELMDERLRAVQVHGEDVQFRRQMTAGSLRALLDAARTSSNRGSAQPSIAAPQEVPVEQPELSPPSPPASFDGLSDFVRSWPGNGGEPT